MPTSREDRVWNATLELVVMRLKQLAASGHTQATALFTKLSQPHSAVDVEEARRHGYLVVPEVLTEEEWEALYSPKDDPPEEDGEL